MAQNILIAAGLGTLAGLHTATWGIYKDSIHEGFFWPRYFRSPIVGAVMAVIAYLIARPHVDTAAGAVAFFGVAYVLERGAVELWKTFLRNEDQGKYFIPMQFAVFGKVVHSQARRLLIGAIITAAAPKSITLRESERMAAKPGADTPTMMGLPLARLITRAAICSASSASSLGASPSTPRMVKPLHPHSK